MTNGRALLEVNVLLALLPLNLDDSLLELL